MIRKFIVFTLSFLLLVVYMILMDPYSNSTLLADIPYGIALLFLVKVFLLIIVLTTMLHILLDYVLDKTYGGYNEPDIVKKAMESPEGAGSIMTSRSLRYIADALIVLGVLIYSTTGQF